MADIYNPNIFSLEECFAVSEGGKVTWLHDKFGSFLINKLHVYSKDNCLYLYKKGIFVRDANDLLRAMQYYNPSAKEHFRKEVMKYCEIAAPILETNDNVNLIGCQNGVYNIETGDFTDYKPEYFLRHKVNAKYDELAYSPEVDKTLDKIACNDKQIRMLIEEMIGYCLHRNCRYQKMFLLSGYGSNGKSTLLDMIRNFIGEENASALSLNDLQDRFKKAELQDRLVNICDDLSNAYISDTENFKKIITGGELTMERKNQQPFKYKNYAKLIMAANEIPKSADKSEGYYRRFVIIPLKAKLSNKDPDYDPNIADKLATDEALSYVLNLAIEGLKRLRKNGRFTETDEVANELLEYKADNDPIVAFVNEYGIDNIHGQSTQIVFDDFNDWYEQENNRKANYNKSTFTKSLKNIFEFRTEPRKNNAKNKNERIYISTTLEYAKLHLNPSKIPKIEELEELENEELPF